MNTREVVQAVATISTVALWLTGITTCRKILRQGNTSNVSFTPFMVMFISCILWIKYGMIVDNAFLIQVNTIGATLNLLFGAVYYAYTIQRTALHSQMGLGSLLLFSPVIYLRFIIETRTRAIFIMGLTCACLSTLTYAAPLAVLVEVISTKSTESMSFSLCLANVFVAMQWYYYGTIMGDLYVTIPNLTGLCLSTFQLCLFLKYGCGPRTLTKKGTIEA